MTILVIDGQGGKLGRSLIENLKKAFADVEITAVGTNSVATNNMLRGGANHAATGKNAVNVACRSADIIVGPIGIAMADSFLGEISPDMANAVASSNAYRVLIPMNLCNTYIAGANQSASVIMEDALVHIRALIHKTEEPA